jgi:hypothetical protein
MRKTYDSFSVSPEAIAYLHGRIDKEIELFAASTVHCTAAELTERLGTLLLATGLRPGNQMSTLRGEAADNSETMATLALGSGSHSEAQGNIPKKRVKGLSAETKKRLSKIAKARWASMSPQVRQRTINKMLKARRAGK